MFKRSWLNTVKSDEGFSVKTLGWTGIKYTQGVKTLFVDSEFLLNPKHSIVVGASGIRKWDSGENIDEFERKKIGDNIYRALVFRGLKVDMRW